MNKLIQKLEKFRKDRDWEQFHKPKDLAISLNLEASEVLEHFQWKTDEEIKEYVKSNKEEIGEELADVFAYLIHLGRDLDINIIDALDKKIDKNEKKYPVEKAKGIATKYNKL